jgi:hypothetical protein
MNTHPVVDDVLLTREVTTWAELPVLAIFRFFRRRPSAVSDSGSSWVSGALAQTVWRRGCPKWATAGSRERPSLTPLAGAFVSVE